MAERGAEDDADVDQTDQWIYIAIEKVTPLAWKIKSRELSEETIKWGLHNVAVS